MNSTTNFSYNDFLSLLFIYSASVDLDFSDAEKELILKKVGIASFDKAYKWFSSAKDIEITDALYSLGHKYCSTEEQKQMAIDDINQIIHANGRKSRVEEDMLLFINKLI